MLSVVLNMAFATDVSFSFQQIYWSFSLLFFVALVDSYMFKDRITYLMHYWFANKVGSKL